MRRKMITRLGTVVLAGAMTVSMFGCGSSKSKGQSHEDVVANVKEEDILPDADGKTDAGDYHFPLKETENLSATTTYPANTEPDPNNRTIFKRLEVKTNVHIDWNAIQSDQWGDKSQLLMSNPSQMTDIIFNADFSDSDLLRFGGQGSIVDLTKYIQDDMPNLSAIFEKYPEYKEMATDSEGHIWALPWIEQLGKEKEAIQTINDMCFINKKWLDFLGLKMPATVDDFEKVLLEFKKNEKKLQEEFKIEGSVIPMSCIVNDGGQDPCIIINGFGEGYGDPDTGKHIAVTDDKKAICTATQEGYKKGIQWLNKLYKEGLIDEEAFTQDWSTYVSKGKSHRYGVCFSWDVANIDNIQDFVPLGALEADTKNITPATGSFTSGFGRGKCVVTAACDNPDLACAWLDQMYDAYQSPQNNWGTYNEDDDFDIFELGKNSEGEPELTHADLGDHSPVEVREAESVNGPLAVLDEYYDKYVTCPDDAAYRLKWIKEIYTPDMKHKYCYPNVFMSADDTKRISDLSADVVKVINEKKSDWIMNGCSDKAWNSYLKELEDYGLTEYMEIYQKYLDKYFQGIGE